MSTVKNRDAAINSIIQKILKRGIDEGRTALARTILLNPKYAHYEAIYRAIREKSEEGGIRGNPQNFRKLNALAKSMPSPILFKDVKDKRTFLHRFIEHADVPSSTSLLFKGNINDVLSGPVAQNYSNEDWRSIKHVNADKYLEASQREGTLGRPVKSPKTTPPASSLDEIPSNTLQQTLGLYPEVPGRYMAPPGIASSSRYPVPQQTSKLPSVRRPRPPRQPEIKPVSTQKKPLTPPPPASPPRVDYSPDPSPPRQPEPQPEPTPPASSAQNPFENVQRAGIFRQPNRGAGQNVIQLLNQRLRQERANPPPRRRSPSPPPVFQSSHAATSNESGLIDDEISSESEDESEDDSNDEDFLRALQESMIQQETNEPEVPEPSFEELFNQTLDELSQLQNQPDRYLAELQRYINTFEGIMSSNSQGTLDPNNSKFNQELQDNLKHAQDILKNLKDTYQPPELPEAEPEPEPEPSPKEPRPNTTLRPEEESLEQPLETPPSKTSIANEIVDTVRQLSNARSEAQIDDESLLLGIQNQARTAAEVK